MVDIVDEQGNILYQTSKQEAHEKGLLHKCVIAELKDKEGNIILVKPFSHRQDAGQYVSPVGGHISSGESEIDALKREVSEEIGVNNIKHYKRVGDGIFNRQVLGRHENHMMVVYEIETDDVLKLGDEAESCKAFSKEELKKLLKECPEMFGDAYHFVVKTVYKELLK